MRPEFHFEQLFNPRNVKVQNSVTVGEKRVGLSKLPKGKDDGERAQYAKRRPMKYFGGTLWY